MQSIETLTSILGGIQPEIGCLKDRLKSDFAIFCQNAYPFFSYVPALLFKKGLYHRNLWPKLAYYPYLAHDRSILRGYTPTLPNMQCLQFENF